MIVRASCLTSKRCATKSRVNASSSSGFDGGLASRMSSTASTRPRPMKFFHTRLTIARAKNGFSGATSQSAKYCRRSSAESSGSGRPSSGRGASGAFSLG